MWRKQAASYGDLRCRYAVGFLFGMNDVGVKIAQRKGQSAIERTVWIRGAVNIDGNLLIGGVGRALLNLH